MALLVWRTTWESPTGDSADRVIWSWGLSGPEPDAQGMIDLRLAVEGSLGATLPAPAPTGAVTQWLQTGFTAIFHECFLATGGAAIGVIDADSPPPSGGGTSGPTETQLVISRLITTPRGYNPIGRMYFGPFGSVGSQRTPTVGMQNSLAQWALFLHGNFQFVGYEPQVIAKQGTALAAGKPIAAYRVDKLWDTQRRRGQSQADPGSTVLVEV